ncbi:hypothetical protein DSM104440_00641 [Usitatibacter palustris]|uniref:Uncharacterized protein n=1 Tax=Usitatibacter palustris TaxID=2732487 RepID=A0A6M4H2Q5_9PROT|nr:hypothetical protein DSM104440_00641 [Usitatibacter palustris]
MEVARDSASNGMKGGVAFLRATMRRLHDDHLLSSVSSVTSVFQDFLESFAFQKFISFSNRWR